MTVSLSPALTSSISRVKLLLEVKNGTCSLLLASKLVKSFHTIQIHLPLQNKSINSPGYWECLTALNRVSLWSLYYVNKYPSSEADHIPSGALVLSVSQFDFFLDPILPSPQQG